MPLYKGSRQQNLKPIGSDLGVGLVEYSTVKIIRYVLV